MSGRPVIGALDVAAASWPGPGDTITRALRGPYRARIYMTLNPVGMVRLVWSCRHKHGSTAEAFKCGKAELARRG